MQNKNNNKKKMINLFIITSNTKNYSIECNAYICMLYITPCIIKTL